MHASTFSYNLTRPYHLKWFTPVAVSVGIVAAVFITFLTIAMQGYQIVSVYTSNPNATLQNHAFFNDWPPFLTTNTKASFSPTTNPIGTKFYTKNTAFKYTLEGVCRPNKPNATDASDFTMGGTGFTYNNQPLTDCEFWGINIALEGLERTAGEVSAQPWGAILTATIACVIDSADCRMAIQFTTKYDSNILSGR